MAVLSNIESRGSSVIPAPLERYMNSSSTDDVIDTLLGSDILYASESYPQLEKTLRSLRFRQLIVTYKRRHDEYVVIALRLILTLFDS